MNRKRIVSKLFPGKREKELKYLSKLPRYTKGNFTWGEAQLQFPDASSFVFMYKELFLKHTYKFKIEKEIPFIIDCGANIGMSVLYLKELFPKSRIVAFEPEKKIFDYLKLNVENLHLENVELINKAVWKEEGKILFSNEGADANRITSLHTDNYFTDSYEVETVKLSDYITDEVDFLKLDIEGAEIEVITEIAPKLKFVKHIFIEYHSFENKPQQLDIILSILTQNNFHYYIDAPNTTSTTPFIKNKDQAFLAFDFFLNIYATQNNP